MMWDNKAELDPAEMKTLRTSNDMEVFFLEQKAKKFKKLYQIQNKPYFGRIDFESSEGKDLLKKLGIEGEYEGIGHCALGYSAVELPEGGPRKENYIYYVD